jgi:Bacterial Ig-like domain (group 2)
MWTWLLILLRQALADLEEIKKIVTSNHVLLKDIQQEMRHNFKLVMLELKAIKDCTCKKAVSATLILLTKRGENTMPLTVPLGTPVVAVFAEWDGPNGTGNQVPDAGPINYTSDNTAVASVDADGNVTGLSAGSANISGVDSVNGLSAQDSVTFTSAPPPPAVSATLTLISGAAPTPPSFVAAVKAIVAKMTKPGNLPAPGPTPKK